LIRLKAIRKRQNISDERFLILYKVTKIISHFSTTLSCGNEKKA
jgi:hypothetical protein